MDGSTRLGEAARLTALRGYGILDTPNEPEFDTIVRKAQAALRVPIVLISLIDENRQWFKARIGLDATETPRCISFCTHSLFGIDMLIVSDATKDGRFAANPLVIGAPYVRFYAGVPLRVPGGYRIGTLCAIDTRPRSGLGDVQIATMRSLAAETVAAMEHRRIRLAAPTAEIIWETRTAVPDRGFGVTGSF